MPSLYLSKKKFCLLLSSSEVVSKLMFDVHKQHINVVKLFTKTSHIHTYNTPWSKSQPLLSKDWKPWAIKKPFEPAVLFSMSLSWMLWYTKICLEGCHQLLNVVTESYRCFDNTSLILVTFLRTTYSSLRCIVNTDMQDQFTKNSWRDSRLPWSAAMLFIVRLVLRLPLPFWNARHQAFLIYKTWHGYKKVGSI